MIEDGEVDRFARPGQFACGKIVSFARPGVAAGMVMGDGHPGAAKPESICDDVSHRQADRCRLAGILLDMEASGRAVDMGNQQVLAPSVHTIKTSGEEAAGSFMAVEERW